MLQHQTLPASFAAVLHALRPCFTAPTFATFSMLVKGMITQTRQCTVTGMLTAAGMAGTVHHSHAHWFFTHSRWSPDRLGLTLLALIHDRLLPPDALITIAVDDTLFRRSGRKIFGTAWHHDPTSPAARRSTAWGNNWVVAGIVIDLPFLPSPICLPILSRLWTKGGPAKPALARELVELITTACPERKIHVVGDAAYGTRHWRTTDTHTDLTVCLRSNAALREIHTPIPGATGRPKLIGQRIGTPADLATRHHWRKATVTRYGITGHTKILEHRCLWVGPLRTQPVRVILVRDPHPRRPVHPYDLAILTTDLHSTAEQIVERYAARWPVETCFHDGKHITGIGQARNRTENAVRRTVPFGFLVHSMVICWYALAGHDPDDATRHRRDAPWYTTKTTPSYKDMLIKLRRTMIAAEFHPGTPRTPTPAETLAVHLAWANAAA